MSVNIYVSLVRRRVETPTPHYTNTYDKLTIVVHISFSERIAIANLSFLTTTPRQANSMTVFLATTRCLKY